MQIARIGLAAVKGTRHQALTGVDLAPHGPVGDRRFAVVDPARAQVLRTVANPALVGVCARWDGVTLTVDFGNGRASGRPETTDSSLVVDYWGRPVRTDVVAGPWSEAFSDHLGRPVVLTTAAPADVVYGAGVSLVTTASLAALRPWVRAAPGAEERAADAGVEASRFRATVVVDTSGSEHDRPGAELSWVGRELQLGAATVRLTAVTARCAVVDVNPRTGRPDLRLLAALPRDGRGTPVFGIEGDVVGPARVTAGDAVELLGTT